MGKTQQYITDNLFKVAAIEKISGIKPDSWYINLETNPRYDKALAVYSDESILPKPYQIQELLDFGNTYRYYKQIAFSNIRKQREEKEQKEEHNERAGNPEESLLKRNDND